MLAVPAGADETAYERAGYVRRCGGRTGACTCRSRTTCGVPAGRCGVRADGDEGLASDAVRVDRTRTSWHELPGTATGGGARTLLPSVSAVRSWPLAAFVILAYAASWTWMLPLVAADDIVERGVGWPTHLPALLGPALAAFVVTALVWGRGGVRDLLGRIGLWRMPARWWAATLSPFAFLGVALAVALAAGTLPGWSDFDRFSGLPAIGVLPIAVFVVLAAFGEEIGWRGFALPQLQRRHGALAAALLVTPIWAVWHVPLFFTVATYRDFAPVGYIGFVLRPRLRLDRPHLALQRDRRQHPRLCGLARRVQPRKWNGRRRRDDRGGHEHLRDGSGVPARRAGAARSEARHRVGSRSPANERPVPGVAVLFSRRCPRRTRHARARRPHARPRPSSRDRRHVLGGRPATARRPGRGAREYGTQRGAG